MFNAFKKTAILAATAFALSLSAANAASGDPIVVINSKIGPVLASAKSGFSLYTFRKDTKGLSSCIGDCIKAQPPFLASPDAQPIEQFDIIVRQDGARQWALDGRPLYFSARDRASGDAFGHGFRDVWDVVKVTGPAAQTAIAPLRKTIVPAKKVAAPIKKVITAPAYVEPVYAAPVYAPKTAYGSTYAAPAYAPTTTTYGNTYTAPAYGYTAPKQPVYHVPTYKY